MTCVVAIRHNGFIYLGGDSQGTSGHSSASRIDPKVFRNGTSLIGYTTSFRMGQLLEHGLKLPEPKPDQTIMNFMCIDFIDAVRNVLSDGGFEKKENEVRTGGNFIVAYGGEIFEVDSDYQVWRPIKPYLAIGSGADIAIGALCAMENLKELSGKARVHTALSAAAEFNSTVSAPFQIISNELSSTPEVKS